MTTKQLGGVCLVGLLIWCGAFLLLMQAFAYFI